MGLALEDAPHEAGEHGARPHLDEGAHPGGVHGLDELDEAHRLGELAGELGAGGGGIGRVGRGAAVGVDRQGGRAEGHLGQGGAEGVGGAGHDLAVEGGADAEALGRDPGLAQGELGGGDGLGGAGEHDLARVVVIGDHHVKLGLLDDRAHRVDVAGGGRHRAGRGAGLLGHRGAAGHRDPQHVVLAEHPGGVQGRDLAEAVAGHGAVAEAHRAQQAQAGQARDADGRLGVLGGGEGGELGGLFVGGEHRAGEAHRVAVEAEAGGAVPGAAGQRELHRELGAHVQVLAALAGEQQADLALGRAHPVEAAAELGVGGVGGLGDGLGGGAQLLREISVAVGDQREAAGGLGVGGLGALLGGEAQGVGRGLGLGGQREGGRGHLGAGLAVQGDEVAAAGVEPLGLEARALVLLDDDVEVAAAETEAADAGPPGVVLAAHPGAGPGVEVEGRLADVELGVRLVDLDGRRQNTVLHRHDGLEQARGAGGGLGVAHLRLHRAERAPLAV